MVFILVLIVDNLGFQEQPKDTDYCHEQGNFHKDVHLKNERDSDQPREEDDKYSLKHE